MRIHGKAVSGGASRSNASGAAARSRSSKLAVVLGIAVLASLVLGVTLASAVAPTVTIENASAVEYTTAHVAGTVDPQGQFTPFRFQVVSEAQFQENLTNGVPGFEGAATLIEEGTETAGPVGGDLAGLQPHTTYHLRLVAENGDGQVEAVAASTFETKEVAAPTVSIDPVSTFTGTTAHFSGTVETNTPVGPLSPAAEVAYRAEWEFQCSPACPGLAGGAVEANETSKAVSVDAAGLEPNTTYEVTLVAHNAGGQATEATTFSTSLIAPEIRTGVGNSDGEGGYFLQGVVNPHNSAVTACVFEYGLSASYGQSIPCESNPGAVNKPVLVTAHPTGLALGTEYHFRVVATNGTGFPVGSADGTFVPTLSQAEPPCGNEAIRKENDSLALPECRSYELTSSSFKNGFTVTPNTIYSEDGSAYAYISFGSFAGAPGQVPNQYLATRSSAGWETEPRVPPSGTVFAGPEPLLGVGEYEAGLKSSLWLMRKADESAQVLDFYIRKPDASLTLIGPGMNHAAIREEFPGPTTPNNASLPEYTGSSSDFSHVVFQLSGSGAFPGASTGPNLYEYSGTGNTEPRLVGLDNAGHLVSQCGTLGGSAVTGGSPTAFHSISTDGRVIFFLPIVCGSGPEELEVWARVDGTTSYDVSQSHCTRISTDPGGACNAPSGATFQGASTDGAHVYFTTTQQLVNGDTDETNDVYEYDLPTASDPHPSPALVEVSGAATEANVQGVVRVSGDGSTIYFAAKGVLAGNQDALGETAVSGDYNLYVWRRDAAHPAGETKFVADISDQRDHEPESGLWVNEGVGFGRPAQSTNDGRYLVLAAYSPLVTTDTDTSQDVYRYDADSGEMVRISADDSGSTGNAEGFDATISQDKHGYAGAGIRDRTAISADGGEIVFETAEALLPGDVNNAPDIYLWKAGHLSLISSGQWPEGAQVGEIDGSGENIFFLTAQALTPNDGDTTRDIYDARVRGGFGFAGLAGCSGESCRSPLSNPPAPLGPATDRQNGTGNVRPRRCPKGKVARGGHCVKKKADHKKKTHQKKTKKHRGKKRATPSRPAKPGQAKRSDG